MAPSNGGNDPPPSPKGKGKAKVTELSVENLAAHQQMVIRSRRTANGLNNSTTTNSPVGEQSSQAVTSPTTGGGEGSRANRNGNSSVTNRTAIPASDVLANAAAINARAREVQLRFNSDLASHNPIAHPSEVASPPAFTSDQDDHGNVYNGHFVCFQSITPGSNAFVEILNQLVAKVTHTRSDGAEASYIWFNDIRDANSAVNAIRAEASDIIAPYFVSQESFIDATAAEDGQNLISNPAPYPGQVVFTAVFLGSDETQCSIQEAQNIVAGMASTAGSVFTIHPIEASELFPASDFFDVPDNAPTPQYRVEFHTVEAAERALEYWSAHTGTAEQSHCGKYLLFTSEMSDEADDETALRDPPTPQTSNFTSTSSSRPASASRPKSVVSSTGRTQWKEHANGAIEAVAREGPLSNRAHSSPVNGGSQRHQSPRGTSEPAFHNDHLQLRYVYAQMNPRPAQRQHHSAQMQQQSQYQHGAPQAQPPQAQYSNTQYGPTQYPQGQYPQGPIQQGQWQQVAFPQMGQAGPSNYLQHAQGPVQQYQPPGYHNNGNSSFRRNQRTYYDNFYSDWVAPRGKKPEEVLAENIRNGTDVRTTIMLRNIPNDAVFDDIRRALNRSCRGRYDFVYLRFDFQKNKNVGYGFVNFDSPETILRFLQNEEGQPYMQRSPREIQVSYAMNQGLDCLIEKFRNSSVMDENPDYRPQTFYTYRSAAEAGDQNLAGTKKPFPAANNLSKKRRSRDNAQTIGLYPRNGHQRPDRRHRSQFDRGNPAQVQEDHMRQFAGPAYQNGPPPFVPPIMLQPAAQTFPVGPWMHNSPQQYMQTQSFQPQFHGAYPAMPPAQNYMNGAPIHQNANFPQQQPMAFNNGPGNHVNNDNNYVHGNGFGPGNANHQNYQYPQNPQMYGNGYAPGMPQTNVQGNGQTTPHWNSQRAQAARMPRVMEEEEALASNDAARNNSGSTRPAVATNGASNGAPPSTEQEQQVENDGPSKFFRNGRKPARR